MSLGARDKTRPLYYQRCMMDEIQVECPIHLDSVPLKDILAFKCFG